VVLLSNHPEKFPGSKIKMVLEMLNSNQLSRMKNLENHLRKAKGVLAKAQV
jgi:hypothetical protein